MRKLSLALLVTSTVTSPAFASTVFSDGFTGEGGGSSVLNFAGFSNFNVTGKVDLIASGGFGITCAGGAGSCVDLDGTPGPGTLTSKATFSFNAGDFVRLSFDLSGSQRSSDSDDWLAGFTFGNSTDLINYGFNFFGTDQIVLPVITTTGINSNSSIAGDAPFGRRSIFFTAGTAGTLTFNIGTPSNDDVGPILDNVQLDIGGVPEPASWAMMIAGFALAGVALRRRQATPALA